MPPLIDPSLCTLCGMCQDVCPGDILYTDQGIEEIVRYPDECSHCGVCQAECPEQAIGIQFAWTMLQPPIVLAPNEGARDA
jgi:adenylylsulfate reductase subunit B